LASDQKSLAIPALYEVVPFEVVPLEVVPLEVVPLEVVPLEIIPLKVILLEAVPLKVIPFEFNHEQLFLLNCSIERYLIHGKNLIWSSVSCLQTYLCRMLWV